jgi:hypothetical protein
MLRVTPRTYFDRCTEAKWSLFALTYQLFGLLSGIPRSLPKALSVSTEQFLETTAASSAQTSWLITLTGVLLAAINRGDASGILEKDAYEN